jgi:hypothetical protein
LYESGGPDTLFDANGQFRFKNELFWGDNLLAEIHYEALAGGGDTRRKQQALARVNPRLLPLGLSGGSAVNDDRRLLNLTGVISQDDAFIWYHRLDRLYLAWRGRQGTIKLGRQALTWGHGFLFNPLDLFNPFSPTDFVRDYKVGDDMALVQTAWDGVDLQLLCIPRREPVSGDLRWDESSLAGKLHLTLGTTELDLMLAQHYGDRVAGLGLVGYLGEAAWRMDATWTALDDSDFSSGYLSLAANLDYSWVWWGKNFYGWAEFFLNGLGRSNYVQALADPDLVHRLQRGELFSLGKIYFDAEVKVELHPLLNLHFTAIVNLQDPSALFQPRLAWDLSQNTQLILGINLYGGGQETEFGGFKLPGTTLEVAPSDSAYCWLTYYF